MADVVQQRPVMCVMFYFLLVTCTNDPISLELIQTSLGRTQLIPLTRIRLWDGYHLTAIIG